MSTIEPALTAAEWRGGWVSHDAEASAHVEDGTVVVEGPYDYTPAHLNPDGRHALAALCLHGQPFGFQRWMALWITTHRGDWSIVPDEVEAVCRMDYEVDQYIADRIEALLPSEES